MLLLLPTPPTCEQCFSPRIEKGRRAIHPLPVCVFLPSFLPSFVPHPIPAFLRLLSFFLSFASFLPACLHHHYHQPPPGAADDADAAAPVLLFPMPVMGAWSPGFRVVLGSPPTLSLYDGAVVVGEVAAAAAAPEAAVLANTVVADTVAVVVVVVAWQASTLPRVVPSVSHDENASSHCRRVISPLLL